MGWFTRFSLRNPVVVFLLALLVCVGGILSAFSLKEELMPNIAFPVIAVVTPYPGASPQAVATDVSDPLENALRNVSGVQTVTSTSVQNVSEITLELSMSADLNSVQQKVEQVVAGVSLPQSAMKPTVQNFSFNSSPVVNFTVASKTASNNELRTIVNQTIVPALQGVAGVGQVQTGGASEPRVNIQFNPAQLTAHNLTMQQVIQDLQADNVTVPLGSQTISGSVSPLQLTSPFSSVAQIKSIPIPIPANPTAGLKDIGKGMQALGTSVGQLGTAVGQIGSAVGQLGQGVSGLSQGLAAVQAENQLISSLQGLQGQLFGAELALAKQQTLPQAQQNPQQIATLQATIAALSQEQKIISQKLTGLQQQLGALGAAKSNSGGVPSIPKTGTHSGTLPATAATKTSGSTNTSTTLNTVPLSDLATVTFAPPNDGSINRTNGQPSVFVGVVKTENANTVVMAKAVNQELSKLQKQMPAGVTIVPLFDSSTMIVASVNGMLREAILGAGFAVLVILLFLRNWRTTIIAVVSIPLSLLIALMVLNRLNITLNIMTLGGMAIATGRVVDDSIVVIENIYRAWKRGLGYGRSFVYFATREVGQAITSSTITTVAVFLPLGFVSGVVGKIFMPFAVTVVCSLLSSLLVALTVVPALAWLFVARRPESAADYGWLSGNPSSTESVHPVLIQNSARADDPFASNASAPSESSLQHTVVMTQAALADDKGTQLAVRPWQRKYQGFLRGALNHKAWVLGITLVLFIGSLAVLPAAGSTFIPASNEKFATISIQMPVGTPRSSTDAKAKQVENVLHSYGSTIDQWNTKVGSDPGQLSPSGSVSGENQATMFLELQPNTNVDSFVSTLRSRLQPLSGPATIQVKTLVMGGSTGGFSVNLIGPNAHDIQTAATMVTSALKQVPGLANVNNNLSDKRPQLNVVPRLQDAAKYGLTPYQIANVVQSYVQGQSIGNANINGQSRAVWVSLIPANPLTSLSTVQNLPIAAPTGQTIKLADVATVQMASAPVQIEHQDGQPYASVSGDFTSKNTGKTSRDALKAISQLKLPSDVQVQVAGDTQEMNSSFKQLIEAILISVGLVYMVMLIAFGGWAAPFAILFSMPVALIGAFFGTVISKQPISVSSLIGILMLMGIVVTNAIVLVDRVEQQRRRGLTVREALLEAGTTRLRPILMTAIATICSLLPLAIGFAEGALISQGLAVVVIGGLISSTALTLFIVPVMYELLHLRHHRREQALAE
ncbi:efflux RND transporter permease subunit [Alicyclobacillus ferrooxydans]|uniref:efflux RND transporter permease subunit n=1 Tax=Alicyclobacillus ferrooxydans TaxID=471514 RepID=UPI0006D54730|nr:efflux RND transporter permease subunit [Alicyclobacillus ferrooxydans]